MVIILIITAIFAAPVIAGYLLKLKPTKVFGVSLSLSSFEKGLWFDHDEEEYQPYGWGIRIHLVGGRVVTCVPQLYHRKGLDLVEGYNPWKGGDWWFVLRMPFAILPFVSIALGKYGIYLGAKTYGVTQRLNIPEKYQRWMRQDEFPPQGDEENRYLEISASIRLKNRWGKQIKK